MQPSSHHHHLICHFIKYHNRHRYHGFHIKAKKILKSLGRKMNLLHMHLLQKGGGLRNFWVGTVKKSTLCSVHVLQKGGKRRICILAPHGFQRVQLGGKIDSAIDCQ